MVKKKKKTTQLTVSLVMDTFGQMYTNLHNLEK